MSAFSVVVKFFAFNLLAHRREDPDGTLLIVQFLSRFLAELFAGNCMTSNVRYSKCFLSSCTGTPYSWSWYVRSKSFPKYQLHLVLSINFVLFIVLFFRMQILDVFVSPYLQLMQYGSEFFSDAAQFIFYLWRNLLIFDTFYQTFDPIIIH